MELIRLSIRGQPPRKSNARRIVTNRATGKHLVIKSKKARQWVADAMKQIPGSARLNLGSAESPLRIDFWVWYETRRPDLSIELILDVLQKARVISDDRHVYETHAYKLFDKDNPGVVLSISETDLSHAHYAPSLD